MFTPVTYEEDDRGGFRTITSVQGAARVLTDWWSVEFGPAYYAAAHACVEALEDHGPEETVRDAFVAALQESGVFVRE